ncbi:MAG: hypothetical protein GY679_02025 [Mycoplasma sp.]|nr:hypothetical protein [Mycoplasma sp.]
MMKCKRCGVELEKGSWEEYDRYCKECYCKSQEEIQTYPGTKNKKFYLTAQQHIVTFNIHPRMYYDGTCRYSERWRPLIDDTRRTDWSRQRWALNEKGFDSEQDIERHIKKHSYIMSKYKGMFGIENSDGKLLYVYYLKDGELIKHWDGQF